MTNFFAEMPHDGAGFVGRRAKTEQVKGTKETGRRRETEGGRRGEGGEELC